MIPAHLSCLCKSATPLLTVEGHRIDVWELTVDTSASFLSNWASQFRQHYCADDEIDALREGTGLTRSEYLTQLAFPDKSAAPGPSVRAGDFSELLVADYVEHLLCYWVPRGKYAQKASRDESVKGVDILGFRTSGGAEPHPDDTLLAFEVKAQLSGSKYGAQLQAAIDDSSKDYVRQAITLNATKQRLLRAGQHERALVVQRFQNPTDNPYIYRSGAAAVLSGEACDETVLVSSTSVAEHRNAQNLDLVVIRGSELMKLVHAIYERAADEA